MKHPLLGQDMEQAKARLTDLTQGEHIIDIVNTYLIIFLISGVTGLVCVVLGLAMVFAKLWRTKALRLTVSDGMMQAYVGAALAANLVALLFTSPYERNPFWLAMALANIRVMTRQVSEPRRSVPAKCGHGSD